jgi:ubiquinone/menaquinone biosynthesis C-methylase UbiE
MTDFDRVKNYYKNFDEKNRLVNDNSGRLEYEMTIDILNGALPAAGAILDLGGGAGAYAFPLAEKGYQVTLADISEDLIGQAQEKKDAEGIKNIVSCDVVNATDLGIYKDQQFDSVLLLGPLYHLTEEEERQSCISEVHRVLKPGGVVVAAFIPYLSGSIGVFDRYFWHPNQVNPENLRKVFDSGKFNNLQDVGFQEGYYATSDEIENLFKSCGFGKLQIRSIRGIGYCKEDAVYSLEDKDRAMFDEIISIINETADNKAVVEMCGHAIYVGKREA